MAPPRVLTNLLQNGTFQSERANVKVPKFNFLEKNHFLRPVQQSYNDNLVKFKLFKFQLFLTRNTVISVEPPFWVTEMSLIASMVKFASKLHPRAKKTWAKFPVPQMCKYVAAWSLNNSYLNSGIPCNSGQFTADQTFHYIESTLYFVFALCAIKDIWVSILIIS